MTEQRFEKALSTAAEAYMINRLTNGSISTEQFVTSKSFEKRINKLIKSEHNLYYKFTLTRARRLLCAAIIIILLLASMLSVGAVREMIANFFVEHFSDHNTVSSNTISKIHPKKIEKLYELSNIPEGFTLFDESVDATNASYLYLNNKNSILFEQNTKNSFSINVDDHLKYNSVIINNQEYLVYKYNNQNGCVIIWDNGEYIFTISTTLSSKTSLNLCNSIVLKN